MRILNIAMTTLVLLVLACGCGSPWARPRARCRSSLEQLGLILKMYANESRGERYPCLSSRPGCLMFANESVDGLRSVYPEYLSDPNILICPSDRDAHIIKGPPRKMTMAEMIDDESYFYLGYAVTSDDDVKAFAEAYKQRIAEGLAIDEDLTAPTGTLHILRNGAERFFIVGIGDPQGSEKAQAKIPILIERPENHGLDGGHVLYMDGHVEFVPYGESGRWPMTETTIETLNALDALSK